MSTLSTKVELRISVGSVPAFDVTSQSDPFVVVYSGQKEIGRTEVATNQTTTAFTTAIKMDYRFEELQSLRFEVWDYDTAAKHDFVGRFDTTLGRIMGSRGATQQARLECCPRGMPTITIHGSEVSTCADTIRLKLKCANLDKKDGGFMGMGGSSDPFLSVSRPCPDGSFMAVWTSTVVKKNINPEWPEVEIPVQQLCNGDYAMPLRWDVYDWDADGTHDFIGTTTVSLGELVSGVGSSRMYPFTNPEKAKKSGYKNSGLFVPQSAVVIRRPTFLEYLAGGCQLNLVVGVDFTGSNGDPRLPSSLHYYGDASRPNEYLQALMSTGHILLDYDSDKRVPMYGFGGAVGGVTKHCFPLTFRDDAPEVVGVDGMIHAYKSAFAYTSLSGPTYFTSIIQQAMEFASVGVSQTSQRYTILLLLTDGQMNDMDATISAIVTASKTPLSIVMVGVGAADFSAMDVLDADKKPLCAGTSVATRDIVQFVPFRKFGGDPGALAAEVLREIPGQVVEYFLSRGILPNPPGPRVVSL